MVSPRNEMCRFRRNRAEVATDIMFTDTETFVVRIYMLVSTNWDEWLVFCAQGTTTLIPKISTDLGPTLKLFRETYHNTVCF